MRAGQVPRETWARLQGFLKEENALGLVQWILDNGIGPLSSASDLADEYRRKPYRSDAERVQGLILLCGEAGASSRSVVPRETIPRHIVDAVKDARLLFLHTSLNYHKSLTASYSGSSP